MLCLIPFFGRLNKSLCTFKARCWEFVGEFGELFDMVLQRCSIRFRLFKLGLFVITNSLRILDLPNVSMLFLTSQKRQQTINSMVLRECQTPLEMVLESGLVLYGILVLCLVAIVCFARTVDVPYVVSVLWAFQKRHQTQNACFWVNFGGQMVLKESLDTNLV